MDLGSVVYLLVWAVAFVLVAVVGSASACCSHCRRRRILLLLDKVTYPRRNSLPASTSGGSGGGGGPPSTTTASSTAAGTAAVSEDCPICLSQFEDGDRCSVMPICHHEFHRDCIAQWLDARNNTCPLCRAKLQWSLVAQAQDDMV